MPQNGENYSLNSVNSNSLEKATKVKMRQFSKTKSNLGNSSLPDQMLIMSRISKCDHGIIATLIRPPRTDHLCLTNREISKIMLGLYNRDQTYIIRPRCHQRRAMSASTLAYQIYIIGYEIALSENKL